MAVSLPMLRVWHVPHSVLFVTGYAEYAILNHGRLARGMQVLAKPFSVDALAQRVSELISAGGADKS